MLFILEGIKIAYKHELKWGLGKTISGSQLAQSSKNWLSNFGLIEKIMDLVFF